MLVEELVHAHRQLMCAFPGQILRWLHEALPTLHQLGKSILSPIVKNDLLLLHEASFLTKDHLTLIPLHCF